MAIVGMLAAHLAGVAAERWGFLHWSNGYPAGAFAVLAGVSMGLTRRMAEPGWRAWPPQLVRSVLLFALGVALASISFGPVVILCVYAALFLLALPFRRLSGPALIGAGLVLTVVTPVVSLWLRRETWFDGVEPGYAVTWTMMTGPDPAPVVARTLILDGVYPLLSWLPLALVGWGACRAGLLDPGRRRHLAGAALLLLGLGFGLSALTEAATHSRAELIDGDRAELVADARANGALTPDGQLQVVLDGVRTVKSPDAYLPSFDRGFGVPGHDEWKVLLTAGHHTGTTFELWQILAVTASFVLGFSLLAAGWSFLAGVGPVLVRVVGWPGRIPLTVYSAHIVVGWQQFNERELWVDLDAAGQARLLAAYVGGAFVLGAIFRHRRGPLEWILHQVTEGTRRTLGPAGAGSGSDVPPPIPVSGGG